MLGPEEFFEGLSIGLKSFFGAGVLGASNKMAQFLPKYRGTCIHVSTSGGITGATARITGTVGDVLSKLTFDEDFIDKRQQQKTRPPKLGQKLGGFARVIHVSKSVENAHYIHMYKPNLVYIQLL